MAPSIDAITVSAIDKRYASRHGTVNALAVLSARMEHWKLAPAGVKQWGENSTVNYRDYVAFMLKWNIIKQQIDSNDLITNELIDEMNKFDAAKVTAEAKAYKAP